MKYKLIAKRVLILFLLDLVTIASNMTLRADETFSPTVSGGNSWDVFCTADNLPNENFTIIVLPDTQHYSESYPWIFDNQTQWIVNNAESMNIMFVTHEGDVVESWDVLAEWDNANSSMSKLDDKVPWGILPGNHDGVCFEGSVTNYNNYFGYERFNGISWYGGAYQTDNNTNNYQLFSAGGNDYLIFHLEYAATDDILSWANSTIDKYPNRRVIVTTHMYLDPDGTRTTIVYFRAGGNSGEEIWQKFIKPHADQIFLVLCGHWVEEARRTDTVDGHVVHQLLANYQDRTNGGNGWLRILKFCPAHDKIYVKTYSPYLNSYETDSNSEFALDYNMMHVHDITVTDVTPSKTAVCQNYAMFINVSVANHGSYTETFNVTAYYNDTVITLPNGKNYTTVSLTNGSSTTVSFTWNTTGIAYGNYTITAVADTVQGETHTADNTLADGDIMVTVPGDANGDRIVEVHDLFIIGKVFNFTSTSPNWNPNADINNNEAVDTYDIEITSVYWGESW